MNRHTFGLVVSFVFLFWSATPRIPVAAADDSTVEEQKWTLQIHSKGNVDYERILDPSMTDDQILVQAIDSWSKQSKSGELDLNSYAPSVVIESDLRRIDFRKTRVIISTRKSNDKSWNQTSRTATEADLKLREQLIEFSKNRK
jgi:hypothetical protein